MDHSIIGRRISEARLKLGMSTQQLAERIGKSQATVSRIENGKQGVTLPLLNTIARVLEIHPFSLLGNGNSAINGSAGKGVLLKSILKDGRVRARLSVEAVASRTGISIDRVEDFETGAAIPDESELGRLCDLYPISTDMAMQVKCAEESCPRLIAQFNSMTVLLNDCLNLLQENRRNADEAFDNLCRRIEEHLCIGEEAADFVESTATDTDKPALQISSRLQQALKDKEFIAKAEKMAQEWFESEDGGGNFSALRKIEGTLDGYSDQN